MSEIKKEFELNIGEGDLSADAIEEINLTDSTELEFSVEIDYSEDDPETVIDSYLNALEEDKPTSVADVAIERLSEEGNKANIFAAGLKIDISTGDKFDTDVMVQNQIDHDNLSSLDLDSLSEEHSSTVQTNFTQKELLELAKIVASVDTQSKVRNLKSDLQSINQNLMSVFKDLGLNERRKVELEAHTVKLDELRQSLEKKIEHLQGFNEGRGDINGLRSTTMRDGVSAMHAQENLEKVRAELITAFKAYEMLKAQKAELEENCKKYELKSSEIQKEMNSVMSKIDHENYVDTVASKYSKIIAIEFGLSKYGEHGFKERPIFIKCQCEHITMFKYDNMPVYSGIKISEYKDYKQKLHSYSRDMMNNLKFDGFTDGYEPSLVCEKCGKPLMFAPVILDNFVKSSFVREAHAIEKYVKNDSTRETPEGYQNSAVSYRLSKPNVPTEYLEDLGYIEYYESKINKINTDPLADIGTDIPLSVKEERIVRMFNPDVSDELLKASMKSFNNLINSVNVFLNMVQSEKLKTKSNSTSKAAIERRRINARMTKFIAEQRWLMISYCINKHIPIQAFKERLDEAYKSVKKINEFQDELFNFFIKHVIECVIEGRDIVYVDSSRHTKLLEVKKRALPHQLFFERYQKAIYFYFKVRAHKTKSLAQLEIFQDVLGSIVEITNIEGDDLAITKSEEIVQKILKDLDSLIEEGLTKEFGTRQKVISAYSVCAEKTIKYLTNNNIGKYPDGNFYAWVAYEAKNNLLNPMTLPTNESLYSRLYGDK